MFTPGSPLAFTTGYGPEIREAGLHLTGMSPEKKNYYVVLKIKDIFNHDVPQKTIVVEEL